MATALQLEMGHAAVVDAQVLDASRVRAEVRTGLIEGGLDARVHVDGVEPVQHQQTLDELVVGEALEQGNRCLGVLVDDLEDALEACAVEFDQEPDDFFHLGTHLGRRYRPKLSEKHLDPVPDLPDVAVTLGHVLPSVTTRPRRPQAPESPKLAGGARWPPRLLR